MDLEKEMKALSRSASLFEVNVPDYKQLKACRKDIVLLKELWDMVLLVRNSRLIGAWDVPDTIEIHTYVIMEKCQTRVHSLGERKHGWLENYSVEGHQCGRHGHGNQKVRQGHQRPGQRDEGLGYLFWAGQHGEEHAHIPACCRRSAESSHQRSPLASAHGGHQGTAQCPIREQTSSIFNESLF